VRLGDVGPGGRLRLDSATRYLQDVSADDTADAALPDAEAWVVRKTVVEAHVRPRYQEHVDVATWCSGTGSHWAERRITIRGDAGGHVEAASTWVHFDHRTGRPKRVPHGFDAIYGEASGGRKVKARLLHPDPEGGDTRPWPLRATDFDVLRHVNNAAYWEAVEEVLADDPLARLPLRAELEHRAAVEPGAAVDLVHRRDDGGLWVWLVADGAVGASARVEPLSR